MANGQTNYSKITFGANVPQIVTLKYTGAQTVQSQITGEDQFLYTCEEGRIYADAALHHAITQSFAGINDAIRITKRERKIGAKRHVDYVVEKLGEAPDPFPAEYDSHGQQIAGMTGDQYARAQRDQAAAAAWANAANVAPRAASTGSQAEPPQPPAPPQPRPPAHPEAAAPAAAPHPNVLAQALCLAIDAIAIADAHAKAKGLAIVWQSEDARALANTMLIGQRNGGAR